MPRSGPNGTYSLPPVYLAVPGTTILVDQHNTPLEDIATTFNTATPVDYGGTGATSVAGAKAALGYLYQSWGAYPTAGGTADALTLTPTDALLALATGVPMTLTVSSSANTGAATIDVSGLGAKAIRKISGGTDVALTAGDLAPATKQDLVYSSTANAAAGAWILVGAGLGRSRGYASTATAAGTTTLTASSAAIQTFTGTTTQTIVLPVVSTLSAGTPFTIINQSTGILTIQSSGANTIVTLMPSSAATFISNAITGTGASVWDLAGPSGIGIDLGAVGQIKFPATQNPSSNANTLDDYEEGTYTPSVTPDSGTPSSIGSISGRYTKIGRLVNFTVTVSIITKNTAAGTINFTLPFTAATLVASNEAIGASFNTSSGMSGSFYLSSTTNAKAIRYDFTTYWVDGTTITASGTYTAAA